MDKENDELRSLFDAFDPGLSSTSDFMSRLDRNIERVEVIKEHQRELRRRGRLAVTLAALAGFVAGALLTLAVPVMQAWLADIARGLPAELSALPSLLPWVLTALVSMGASREVYETILARK